MTRPTVLLAALLAASCAPYPKRINHEPVLTNKDKVPEATAPALGTPAGLAPAPQGAVTPDAMGRALIDQGDELVAFGKYAEALDRYNRASVLLPNEPMVDFKVGRLLDLQMQPYEAAIRYRRFLHSLELEKIAAHGNASAQLADAIAMAQQRLVIIDKR